MTRSVLAGVLCAFALVSLTPGVQADVPTFRYRSPSTPLTYEYDTATGRPDGPLTAFSLHTSLGEVRGAIDDDADRVRGLSRIALTHVASGQQGTITFVESGQAGLLDIHADYGELGQIFVRADNVAQVAQVVATSGIDCATFASSPLYAVQTEAAQLLALDYESSSDAVPAHLALVASAVLIAKAVPTLVESCEGFNDPHAGGCYYDNETWSECSSCCEAELPGNVISKFCAATGAASCGPWCGMITWLFCDGLVAFGQVACVEHNCTGKPGDPGCPAPAPPCPGLCMSFCGPGHSSECGECPDVKVCCD